MAFIDTIKYFQQSRLAVLANTMTDEERERVKNECKTFISRDPKLDEKFKVCSEDDQEWVLKYLSSGKGVVPYEMITRFDSLDISPEEGVFFLPHHFYSSLKETIITNEDYNSVKKLYQTMKLENLGELNKLYNFQGTIICARCLKTDHSSYKSYSNITRKKCNSASSFSGCVRRDKSKCLIVLPTKLNMSGFLKYR